MPDRLTNYNPVDRNDMSRVIPIRLRRIFKRDVGRYFEAGWTITVHRGKLIAYSDRGQPSDD